MIHITLTCFDIWPLSLTLFYEINLIRPHHTLWSMLTFVFSDIKIQPSDFVIESRVISIPNERDLSNNTLRYNKQADLFGNGVYGEKGKRQPCRQLQLLPRLQLRLQLQHRDYLMVKTMVIPRSHKNLKVVLMSAFMWQKVLL